MTKIGGIYLRNVKCWCRELRRNVRNRSRRRSGGYKCHNRVGSKIIKAQNKMENNGKLGKRNIIRSLKK